MVVYHTVQYNVLKRFSDSTTLANAFHFRSIISYGSLTYSEVRLYSVPRQYVARGKYTLSNSCIADVAVAMARYIIRSFIHFHERLIHDSSINAVRSST